MNTKLIVPCLVLAFAGALPMGARAQICTATNVNESFTGATSCPWNFYGGACLTAGTSSSYISPGVIPACVGDPYYGAQIQLGGNSGNLNLTPDTPITGGALRLTNDAFAQSGAIVSTVPFSLTPGGLQVTFTTETYEGNSGGGNHDGADGMSFFLQDASYLPTYGVTLGDWGGSLGYTCSNVNNSANQGYDGMVGAYLGLGIDEYGNFLNGDTINSSGVATYNGDNTSSGYGYVPNRVGMRGAGSTKWAFLSTNPTTAAYYPLTLTAAQQRTAVQQACETGYVWDYTVATGVAGPTVTNGVSNPYNANPVPAITLPNYAVIPNAWKILTHKIANEAALYRGYGTSVTPGNQYGIPITYSLSITPSGLLSLAYSYNQGTYQPIISGQSITAANGSLPNKVLFGFGGSTGGSKNIHEIMCFQATPLNSASSSAGLNQKQTAKVQSGTQVYFAFYNSNNWTGSLTSQYLDTSSSGNLQIDPAVNWDASCVLTGCAGPPSIAAEDPDAGRVILSYNRATQTGIPFTWSASGATPLSAREQANLDYGDPSPAGPGVWPQAANLRLEYLRGQRGDEQNIFGVDPNTPTINPSGFRARTSVLGDIIDSSPTWTGAPSATFPATWSDRLNPTATLPENSGPTYASFQANYVSRMNVVYAGANDGFLHGFRTGFFNANGSYNATNNDGLEVLAYMPRYVVNSINSSTTLDPVTGTTSPDGTNDYSNPQYAHKFSVDGTPGTGDLFYGGQWHTWLVAGLGAGGSAIYALDITNPGTPTQPSSFTEGNAANLVIGEWSSSLVSTIFLNTSGVYVSTVTGGAATFTCAINPTCGNSLGKTYGTPQIRRFHNDPMLTAGNATSWGAVFGNGSDSYNDDAGIFVMLASNTPGAQPTFYYLSTGVGSRAGTPNGIYFVTAADLDGDHITDYVYAGDLLGNIWRFDLTSTDPSQWTVTQVGGVPTPIYTTQGGSTQPITTQLMVASVATGAANPRVLVEFGTGEQTQFSTSTAATYSNSQQDLIGVWDWNMSVWNAASSVQYDSLSATTTPVAPTAGPGLAAVSGHGQLEQQQISGTFDNNSVASVQTSTSATAAYYRTVTSNAICWADQTGCSGAAGQYGWYLPLGSGYANSNDPNFLTTSTSTNAQLLYEQVIFSPTLQDGSFIVNTTIPPTTTLATCSATAAGGWTMAINPATGGAFTNSFFADANHNFLNIDNQAVSGIALSGTGSPSVVTSGSNTYIVTQTTNGTGAVAQINPPGGTQGSRLTWIEKR